MMDQVSGIPDMLDSAIDGSLRARCIQGADILQSDSDARHVAAGLAAMDCVIVHDLILNETANHARVLPPGSTVLEKSGTLAEAERRIQMVRTVTDPANGWEDREVTQALADAMGLGWSHAHSSEIVDEIARLTPTFASVSHDRLDAEGALQRRVNEPNRDDSGSWRAEVVARAFPEEIG